MSRKRIPKIVSSAPAPPATAAERLDTVKDAIESMLRIATKTVDEFREDIAGATYTRVLDRLSWSARAFTAAARVEVLQIVLDALAVPGNTPGNVHAYALGDALRAAKYPRESTSLVDNYAHQCRGAVWADVEEVLRYALPRPTDALAQPEPIKECCSTR